MSTKESEAGGSDGLARLAQRAHRAPIGAVRHQNPDRAALQRVGYLSISRSAGDSAGSCDAAAVGEAAGSAGTPRPAATRSARASST